MTTITSQAWPLTITWTSAPDLYVDTGATPNALLADYASYVISNTTTAVSSDIWVGVGSFASSNVGLAPGEDGVFHLGTLNPGQSKAAYFYLTGTTPTAALSYVVSLYPSKPPAAAMATQAFTFTTVELVNVQSANNTIDIVVSGPNPPALGGVIQMAISGSTGTIGGSEVLAFTPASYIDWPADNFELFRTTIQLFGANAGTFTDQLIIPTPLTGTGDTPYVATYYFRALSPPASTAKVSPIGYFASGAQIKHTTTGGWINADFLSTSELTNTVTLTKTAATASAVWPEPAGFAITLNNSGFIDVSLDYIYDVLAAAPGVPTVEPGSSMFNGLPIPDPSVSGTALVWSGVFPVAAYSSSVLSFALNYPSIAGIYTDTAKGYIGSIQIDTTIDATDNSPAAASLQLFLPTATPTPTITPSFTITVSKTITQTFSASPTDSPTALGTYTETPTFSASPTPSASPSATPTAPGTYTSTPTPSRSSTPSATPSASPTISRTFTRTWTLSPTVSPTYSASPTRTASPPGTPTFTPSFSASPSATRSSTPTPSSTRTPTPTATETRTATPTRTSSATPSFSASPTPSFSSTPSPTWSASPTFSHSPTQSDTWTASPTFSSSPTFSHSPSGTPTATATTTATATRTPTATATPTRTATETSTISPTRTVTATASATPTATETSTASPTRTITATFSASPTFSVTPTITQTSTLTPSFTSSPTPSPTHTAVTDIALTDPRPNPLRPLKGELLRFDVRLASPGAVKVKVYNLAAELVRTLVDASFGNGTIQGVWDGKNERGDWAAAGVYYLVMEAPGTREVRLVGVLR